MQNYFSKSAAAAVVAIFGAVTATSAMADRDSCNGISGYYGNVTSIIVGPDDTTMYMHLAGGRQHGYGTCQSDGSFQVNFPEYGENTGTFDGTTIQWDNNTTWTKVSE